MTNDELKAIEDRANAAQPGPWLRPSEKKYRQPVDHEGQSVWPWDTEADMVFAYAARTDVPALIAEVRRLQTLCASHEEYIEGSERDAF